MSKLYLVFCALVCLILFYANTSGISFFDAMSPSHWSPRGPGSPGGHGGSHTFYHK